MSGELAPHLAHVSNSYGVITRPLEPDQPYHIRDGGYDGACIQTACPGRMSWGYAGHLPKVCNDRFAGFRTYIPGEC